MATPLKYLYNDTFFENLVGNIRIAAPHLDTESLIKNILNEDWQKLELKERMRHITKVLYRHISGDYQQKVATLLDLLNQLQSNGIKDASVEYMFLPDFVEYYGLEYFDTSIHALEKITVFTSAEFAVRPFIIQYPEQMLIQMLRWSKHTAPMVRRLATEGCRPRLPWAMALPKFKKNPKPILPILERLKNDTSESVRRSVANNLNDISKDHPDLITEIAQNWYGENKKVDWVVKHACRTLLKQGNQKLMQLFGFGSIEQIDIQDLEIKTPSTTVGDYLKFEFKLYNLDEKSIKIRLEYAIYYQKANGSLSRKVFKISEKDYAANSLSTIERRQSFKLISTRKYHLGLHQLALIINGNELEKLDFQLVK